ncbi:hypothetical protein J6590_046002 [Homalodisca vitripennis]|nr:hypothetical protein J6590_046002 [Homalodisca vitripennis]
MTIMGTIFFWSLNTLNIALDDPQHHLLYTRGADLDGPITFRLKLAKSRKRRGLDHRGYVWEEAVDGVYAAIKRCKKPCSRLRARVSRSQGEPHSLILLSGGCPHPIVSRPVAPDCTGQSRSTLEERYAYGGVKDNTRHVRHTELVTKFDCFCRHYRRLKVEYFETITVWERHVGESPRIYFRQYFKGNLNRVCNLDITSVDISSRQGARSRGGFQAALRALACPVLPRPVDSCTDLSTAPIICFIANR